MAAQLPPLTQSRRTAANEPYVLQNAYQIVFSNSDLFTIRFAAKFNNNSSKNNITSYVLLVENGR